MPAVIPVNIIQNGVKSYAVLVALGLVAVDHTDTKIVKKLEQDFKQQAVKTQDESFRADVVDNLHLCQCIFENV